MAYTGILPGGFVNASSANATASALITMALNITNSSGTINTATSALSYSNQLLNASSAIGSMLQQMAGGMLVSS